MKTFQYAKVCLPVGLAALAIGPTVAARAQYAYDITPIAGTPEGLNNLGQVVGYYFPAGSSVNRAFEYSDGQFTDLASNGPTGGSANAINDSGVIAGGNSNGSYFYNTNTGQLTSLHQDKYSYADGINQNGDMVGAYGPGALPYIYSNSTGTIQPLANNGIQTAVDINNLGQVTGEAVFHNPNSLNAFIYTNGVTQNLGSLPGYNLSSGTGINDSGEVVGIADSTDINLPSHAFFYKNGVMNDLGAIINPQIDSFALGLNNAGDIVGSANFTGFLYHNGQVEDLNSLIDPSLGWNITSATAINNNGQIIGFGNLGGFLMTPHVAATPAPGSLLVFGVGLSGLLLAARRRKRASPMRAMLYELEAYGPTVQ